MEAVDENRRPDRPLRMAVFIQNGPAADPEPGILPEITHAHIAVRLGSAVIDAAEHFAVAFGVLLRHGDIPDEGIRIIVHGKRQLLYCSGRATAYSDGGR
jgi:hypothetical protein